MSTRAQLEPPAVKGLKERLELFKAFVTAHCHEWRKDKIVARFCLEHGLDPRRVKGYLDLLLNAELYGVWKYNWLVPWNVYMRLRKAQTTYWDKQREAYESIPSWDRVRRKAWRDTHEPAYENEVSAILTAWRRCVKT